MHPFDPNAEKTEAGRSLQASWGQPDGQGYIKTPCIKKTKMKKERIIQITVFSVKLTKL